MPDEISGRRKGIYYLGIALMVIGLIFFGSTFLSFAGQLGHPSHDFESFGRSFMLRAFFGIVLVGSGSFVMNIGRRGMAGSGVILDPKRARGDIEPWSRMAGGMAKDALDEAGISLGNSKREIPFDDELRRLHRLREEKLISDEEYEAKKKQILDRA